MTSREERAALNEVRSREANESLEFRRTAGSGGRRFLSMVCECGHASCDRSIEITLLEYERVRSDPLRFAVRSDHVMDDIEFVVEENDRFVVVVKRPGKGAAVASKENPRR